MYERIINLTINQKYQLKDITILVRTNNEGSIIAKYLYTKGINVISPESLMLNSSFTIRLLINSLNYLINKNKIFLTGIYLNYIRLEKKSENIIITDELLKSNDDFNNIVSLLENLQKMNLYDICEELIKIFDLKKDKDNYIYIQAFLDVIHNYSTKFSDDIKNYLNWWEEHKNLEQTSVRMPDNINAVKIFSIHKSKGLEFPVVIMPFGIWDIGSKNSTGFIKNYIWTKPEKNIISYSNQDFMIESSNRLNNTYFKKSYNEEEKKVYLDNLNLYYVAWTRAVKELYVFIKDEIITQDFSATDLILNSLDYLVDKKNITFNNDTYYTGKKSINRNFQKESSDYEVSDFVTINWNEKILINKNTSYNEKIIKGNIIHKILSNIIVEEDIDFASEKILKDNYIINLDYKDIMDTLHKIMSLKIDNKKCSDWFKKNLNIEIEKSIYTIKGIIRPDRIVFLNDSVDIIDYKTGEEDEQYKYQLNNYSSALKSMNYKNVNKYLIYIDLLKIIKI